MFGALCDICLKIKAHESHMLLPLHRSFGGCLLLIPLLLLLFDQHFFCDFPLKSNSEFNIPFECNEPSRATQSRTFCVSAGALGIPFAMQECDRRSEGSFRFRSGETPSPPVPTRALTKRATDCASSNGIIPSSDELPAAVFLSSRVGGTEGREAAVGCHKVLA